MGRELRRVPPDFTWPLKKQWAGFINPFGAALKDCDACGRTGYNPPTRLLTRLWYYSIYERETRMLIRELRGTIPADLEDFALAVTASGKSWCDQVNQEDVAALCAADRLWYFTRTPRTDEQRAEVERKVGGGGNSWLPHDNGYIPTADEVNAWNRKTMGHDALSCYICIKARGARYGVYGLCPICNGKAYICDAPTYALYEAWEKFDPPTGEGWQVWETVTEGSPISPVFADQEGVIAWLVGERYSEEGAAAFVRSRWVPSAVMMADSGGTVFLENIESAVLMD